MQKSHKIYLVFLLAYLVCVVPASAQKKKKPAKPAPVPTKQVQNKQEPKKDTIVIHTDSNKTKPAPTTSFRKIDTTIIFDKSGKPIDPKAIAPAKPVNQRKVDTIIYVDNGRKPPPQPDMPRRIDTVIIISKGSQKKALLKDMPKSDIVKIEKVNELCGCVKLDVKSEDTLRYQDYINYSFSFKNNCKERVFINSGAFGFLVFNPNGSPVRVLRKLDYVKQYRYPDFVEIRPGEEYIFQFGDDPFFQFDLRQGWQYKFTFTHYNTTRKYKQAPNDTYLCNEFRNKTIIVK